MGSNRHQIKGAPKAWVSCVLGTAAASYKPPSPGLSFRPAPQPCTARLQGHCALSRRLTGACPSMVNSAGLFCQLAYCSGYSDLFSSLSNP